MNRSEILHWLLVLCALPAAAAEPAPDWDMSLPLAVAPQAVREGRILQRQPAAAFGADVCLVAWSDGSRDIDRPTADIYCARIDAMTGKPLDPQGIRLCSAADLQEWPVVASDGSGFLVVWQDFRSGKHYDLYAARVNRDGKVLDPDGFPVFAGPSNQCRPGVAFAGGNWIVVWMDARTYPVYGVYGARISAEGIVLDPGGFALDVENTEKIAKAQPAGPRWMGDRDYWWQHLASRYLPVAAARGDECLVAYLRETPFAGSGRPQPTALVLNGREGRVQVAPVQLPGGAHDTLAACATPHGWTVVLSDHAQGWGLAPRLAAVRLDTQLKTEDAFAKPHSQEADRLPLEALDKSLMPEGTVSLNPGKGAVAFWRPAAAWDGDGVVVATDFGWRQRGDANAITYVVAVNRVAVADRDFMLERSAVAASTDRADQAVANPALCAARNRQVLLVYEHDEAIDRHVIQARLIRPKALRKMD